MKKKLEWIKIEPNEKQDWINQRDGLFDTLIPLTPEKKFDQTSTSVFTMCSNGAKTQRDSWSYNSSETKVEETAQESINFYNDTVKALANKEISEPDYKTSKISWTRAVTNDVNKGKLYDYNDAEIRDAIYRPFFKQKILWYTTLVERRYRVPHLYPCREAKNLLICVSGIGVTKKFSCIISDILPDLELIGKSQCYPFYWYEENKNTQASLFDDVTEDKYIKRDGISDWILKNVRSRFGNTRVIDKETIFYYVYGLLHSPDYRARFADDLKKSLPRILIVDTIEEFMEFSSAGRKLAALHLNYETIEAASDVTITDILPEGSDLYEHYRVHDKMRFRSKNDKSAIIYNGHITIENIPAKAYEYVVNGKSAIEWLVERYCVSQDKASLIENDANDWGKEHGKPRYILNLVLSVINVSCQTVDIVNSLPKLKF